MIAAEIHAGQRWQATSAPDDLIDVDHQVDEGLFLVRTELGSVVEMADSYLLSSYRPLVSVGKQPAHLSNKE